MAGFHTLDTLPALKAGRKGLRVLLRGDLNVPVRDGRVTDATRLERLAPTIHELAHSGHRVVVMSHFGRPKGKPVPEMSLKPLAGPLSKALGGRDVTFIPHFAGAEAESAIAVLPEGGVALLENLRFDPGEEANDPAFVAALAKLGDVYVNDAFSAAHRAHASTEGLAHRMPSCAGRLMQAELEALDAALGSPARPVLAIVGGAKVSTKLDLLNNLVGRVDALVIGGAMANTFLAALGTDVGASLCEHDLAATARTVMATADEKGCDIVLPSDVVVAEKFEEGADSRVVRIAGVPRGQMILDVGPGSAQALCDRLGTCRTLLWNGPLGAFEVKPFDAGTNAVAREAARLTKAGTLLSVAGGGDTVSALANAGVQDDFSYVSTAGGAFLEWLEGKPLPGVAALEAVGKKA
ncbi:MAG: phosphoglycerate kinase [Alphaproteobacteria bacterium]|nr:phosphoglycerate kinase [Alphaproteobacteria bacterium]